VSAPTVPLDNLPPTRRAIVDLVKRQGEIGTADVATQLGMTSAAVRQQTQRLVEDGLLEYRDEPGGRRGRPRRVFVLAPAGEALFPKRYGDLTTELLGYLGGPESEQVRDLFEQRRKRRVAEASRRMGGLVLAARVRELTRILDEDGYLADFEELADGSWRITEHNCAILTVAHGFGQACSSEMSFIREVLPGATVERVAHLMDGAHVCAYLIRPEE
jgi:DeoR family transcriptional regulator, suf operon transcriptional repressor